MQTTHGSRVRRRIPRFLLLLQIVFVCCGGSTASLGAARPVAFPTEEDAQDEPPQQHAQGDQPTPPGPEQLVAPFRWRSIGPANMMGRIAAIEALDADHRVVAVASASGGVFLSHNAGVTWTPIFDRYGSGSIGAVALFPQDPDVIWVGTGEAANRNSSGWGDGVYKSRDGGETFANMGLRDTRQIAEIAVHPTDRDTVYVAAVGGLWGYSGSRGLYKTTDGGASWQKLQDGLPDDGQTGCTEVILSPADPETVLCGMYHRIRGPATMHSGGPGGGIFKSVDGGASWHKLTLGLPAGDTGMIDLAICKSQPKVIVANVEADERLPADLSVPGPGVYRSDDGGESWRYLLRHNTRPFYHGQVDVDPNDPDRIFAVSRDFQVSDDGGGTWRNKWWPGGGDDHDFWISPADSRVWYMATDQGAYLTVDGGETAVAFDNMAIGQYYAIGVDLRDPYQVVGGLQDNGLWLGPSNSRERRGILNCHNTWIAEGDGFHAQIDPTDWRTVYTVNHVGFVARQDVEQRAHTYITPTPETVVNLADWVDLDSEAEAEKVRYTIAPGEHWFFGERPDRPLLPPQFRFNWSSPLVLSPNNPKALWFGSNHLFKSIDRGDSWRIVSPDLTTDDPALLHQSEQGGLTRSVTGGENHCTIVTISESPLDPAVVWVGTDDGNVQRTRDGGASWHDVRSSVPAGADGVPPGAWVSRVEASHHAAGTCWVAFDDHRRDDTRPFVWVTTDFGASWRNATGDLPKDGSVYVVEEDPRNAALVFCGTEFGCFASVDGGARWVRLGNGLPTVAVHDLVVHPREMDLIAGTHGRSIWILDDITPLQQLTPAVLAQELHLFESRVATRWARIDLGRKQPSFLFRGENPPRGALLHFYLRAAPAERVQVEVRDPLGDRRWTRTVRAASGINRVRWPMTFPSTESERQAMAARLAHAVDTLLAAVPDAARRARLAELRLELDGADDDRELNAVRGVLVDEFAAWALGRPLFGRKIGPSDAPAGRYRVRVVAGAAEAVGTVLLRDDPLGAGGR